MKYMMVILLLIMLVGCTSRNEYGECIGVSDIQNPELIYKLNAWNIFLAIVFSEMILPPLDVVINKLECPAGRKQK